MQQTKITIATYNVLADAYIKPEYYPGVDPRHLASPARYERVVERVAKFDADVICLQEVDYALFVMAEKRLRTLGYDGRWAHKSMGKPDGCAMFLGPDCGSCDWHIRCFYDEHLDSKPSGHVILMADFIKGELGMLVTTAHLKWAPPDTPSESYVGLVQAEELLTMIEDNEPLVHGSIVCGDFNAVPGSPLLALFEEQDYVDAHAASTATFLANDKPQKLDYLLYSRESLRAEPQQTPDITKVGSLPSDNEPSDHLPLIATFFPK